MDVLSEQMGRLSRYSGLQNICYTSTECICGLYFLNSVFLSLVKAADLDDVLSRPGEWTLFVPTNDAFKGLTDDDKDILISK